MNLLLKTAFFSAKKKIACNSYVELPVFLYFVC